VHFHFVRYPRPVDHHGRRRAADSLLAPDIAAQYRVIRGSGINDSGQISGVVRRKSDNAWLAVLFNPIH
jgi:hypothetical protein